MTLMIQCTHDIQVAYVGMLQLNKSEAKVYAEKNVMIAFLIIDSYVHSG